MKRYTAHGEKIPLEDIECNYKDILDTANEYNFEMTNFRDLAELLKQ
jgi:hypothetical protein